MDPFTEKLLERTRARRENLQKKLAERPNAANRQMVKRPREPLTDTNSVIGESVTTKDPQLPSRPSPSKRRCSEENSKLTADEENQEPVVMQAEAPVLSDPPTDKKPPMVPTNTHPSSLEKASTQLAVQSHPRPLETPDSDVMPASPGPDPPTSREAQIQLTGSAPKRNKEELVDNPTSAVGMKSRLQRLADQRKNWDADGASDDVPDCTPLSLKRQADVQPPATAAASSGTPLGRRGRLANLAATIGSWEDDLSQANPPKEKPGTASALKFPLKDATLTSSNPSPAVTGSTEKPVTRSIQGVKSPVKPQVVLPSSKNGGMSSSKSTSESALKSPQKSSSHGKVFPAASSTSTPVSQSPLKNQVFSRNLNHTSQKPGLSDRPGISGSQPHQQKATAAAPGVKSFLERFGERCQERSNQSAAPKVSSSPKTPGVNPPVTPNTRLVQERLRAAQAAHTTTAELTQRQKLERESELAQIRHRFQKGNSVVENNRKEAEPEIKTEKKLEKPLEVCEVESQDEATAASGEGADACKSPSPAAPPASTSSPLKLVENAAEKMNDETPENEEEEEEKEEVKEIEMNVDQSINSAVINELFDAVLEQSDDLSEQEGDEEEDALNISSMSILAPLTETVSAVVKSPERRIVTSTPANSFSVKSDVPQSTSNPSRFQRSNMMRTASSDSVEASDEDHKLPYSIDAYRSTRVKETERPGVKQVIVRKEDVARRSEEPTGSCLFSIKQKLKILTNEMNLQQTVIHQASQALNCCTDEEHGKGSQVEAEAERLLLVATWKREMLKAELERLRGHPAGPKKAPAAPEFVGASASKGSISLQEFRLPLKADFVCSTVNKPESTKHSFFIMIYAGAEKTVATPLASTHCGLNGDTITFPTKFTLSDISSDFKIMLEVYCLVQKREVCNDKKKRPSKSKMIWRHVHEAHDLCMSAITPKRFLAITKSAQTPVVASPGGPNAVRTSHFVLVGSHTLTLSSIGKNKFPLEKVPFLCPLEGHVHLKMQCEVGSKVEERGFLTMFEDVSGFGAWHRRWCVLSGYCISYWTYPDDEKRKNAVGRINLSNCTSRTVEPASREFCARPNTFELITVRPRREDDRETLVSQCRDTMCVTKNWLSADTKDERNLWMKKLNQILVDLRVWQPDSCYRPQ